MLFKKEFDIDKEFFSENETRVPKRKVALRVFLLVLFVTFAILCYSAFSFNFNTRFGSVRKKEEQVSLKEVREYYYEAIRHYEEGNYPLAIEYLNKQLLIVDDPDAYNYLARIYLEMGDKSLAVENFKKALSIQPDAFESNYELGKIYYALNDYKTASKYLTKASTAQIENIEVLSMTAEAYKMTGRADEAIVLFEKILELEPESTFANAKIGEIYFQRLLYKKAIPYLEDAIQIAFDENVALQLAKCYLELGSLESAKNVADDILSENKDNKQAASLKVAIDYKLGLLKQASKTKNEENKKRKPETPIDPLLLSNYIKDIEMSIKTNWTPPVGSNLKKASVKFTVNKEGELVSNVIFSSSGLVDFDKSALDAIELSKPFPPLPETFNRDTLDIIFTFDFNVK